MNLFFSETIELLTSSLARVFLVLCSTINFTFGVDQIFKMDVTAELFFFTEGPNGETNQ